jgi:hypothetical protein
VKDKGAKLWMRTKEASNGLRKEEVTELRLDQERLRDEEMTELRMHR